MRKEVMKIEKITIRKFKKNKDTLYNQILELLKDEKTTEENKLYANQVIMNMETFIKDNTAIIYTISDEEEIDGFIWAYIIKDSSSVAHINYFYIKPQYRSMGYGTTLLNKIIEELKKLDCSKVNLYVKKSNINGYKFYEKKGFKQIKEKKDRLFLEKVV